MSFSPVSNGKWINSPLHACALIWTFQRQECKRLEKAARQLMQYRKLGKRKLQYVVGPTHIWFSISPLQNETRNRFYLHCLVHYLELTSKHCNCILNTTNNGCLPASLFPQLDSIVQSTSHRTAGRKYSPWDPRRTAVTSPWSPLSRFLLWSINQIMLHEMIETYM